MGMVREMMRPSEESAAIHSYGAALARAKALERSITAWTIEDAPNKVSKLADLASTLEKQHLAILLVDP